MSRFVLILLVFIPFITPQTVFSDQNDQIIRDTIEIRELGLTTDYILIKPFNHNEKEKYPLFVFIHGLGSSPKYMLEMNYASLITQKFFILIPQGPEKYDSGYSWYTLSDWNIFVQNMDRDEQIIKALIHKVRKNHKIDASRIVLSGFSQGGRVSFYTGFKNPKLFSDIIPIAGVYMPSLLDNHVSVLGKLKVYIFHGTKDGINSFDAMKKAFFELRRKGVHVELITYPLGHTYTTQVLVEAFKIIQSNTP